MAFSIQNRRYTGCKMKLTEWIKNLIKEHCHNCHSFCDIFAGTGVVSASLINEFNEIHINDFLFSNEVIFKAFFLEESYSEEVLYRFYNNVISIDNAELQDNYVSLNYGGNFFSYHDALIIGEIRQRIEDIRNDINEKEYSILLASLLFSADRVANTCGHYDAYIKKENIRSNFKFELIEPIIKNAKGNIRTFITREDANVLGRNIVCDVVYLDPPYSSRQYSRFYHVLEVLTKWNNPILSGEAHKPPEENMSEYCKSKAIDAFKSLIYGLNCRYIVVSYNNTYNSKSSSSKNKMTLEEINDALNNIGRTEVFHHEHKAFNAGKTELDNHEEILFITTVGEQND